MEVSEKQPFNLWDTNGRRNDILNALSTYLNILKEMKDEGYFDQWAAFPNSSTQIEFYRRAIEQSKEVFKKHDRYDLFAEKAGLNQAEEINKKALLDTLTNNPDLFETLDTAIEQRARHYSSNLVRFGFATDNRSITNAGQAFLNNRLDKDRIESFLPLGDINVLFLRQLAKLRVFSKEQSGKRKFYSPFFVSLYLLIKNESLSREAFSTIVQGLGPYVDHDKIKTLLNDNNIEELMSSVVSNKVEIPPELLFATKIEKNAFSKFFKNRKSSDVVETYYDFYSALFDFVGTNDDEKYSVLKSICMNNKEKIGKAFNRGQMIFDFGPNGVYDLPTFLSKNSESPFLTAGDDFNRLVFESFQESKQFDAICEYSDTTRRALGATGLFRFKPNVSLPQKRLVEILFSKIDFQNNFFGEMTEEEYSDYEKKEENSFFGSNVSLTEILHYDDKDVDEIINDLYQEYKTTDADAIKQTIETVASNEFKKYIDVNYPKDKLLALLKLFSDRKNDSEIKKLVNPAATVPTIYEYIIGIAWYYISNKDFDLYASLNMTLNADFEPEMHAGGLLGDIVINYPDKSIMLEVTLMNKTAQRRGEWEPVLRHSLNNKADHSAIDTMTFFIADELDYNTINIWRAVASAPLRSTGTNAKDIQGVTIMPFRNADIIGFIERSVNSETIIEAVKESFKTVPMITDKNWFDDIIKSL